MKPFLVVLRTTIVVMAENATDALEVANRNARDACRYDEPKAVSSELVTSLADLRCGWDGLCIPYGGDGNTRLGEILQPNA